MAYTRDHLLQKVNIEEQHVSNRGFGEHNSGNLENWKSVKLAFCKSRKSVTLAFCKNRIFKKYDRTDSKTKKTIFAQQIKAQS